MDLMARAVRPPQQKEGGRTTLDAISLLSQFKTNLNSGFRQVDADGDFFSGVDVGVVRLLEGPFQLLGINYKLSSGWGERKGGIVTLSCDEVNVVRMRRCFRFSACCKEETDRELLWWWCGWWRPDRPDIDGW